MIKYFCFERCIIDNEIFIKNEKILDSLDLPESEITFGWCSKRNENIETIYVDVDKRINFRYKLDDDFQEIYDRLLLIEIRNKKLETL